MFLGANTAEHIMERGVFLGANTAASAVSGAAQDVQGPHECGDDDSRGGLGLGTD